MANPFTRAVGDRLLERATELSRINATGSGVGYAPSSTTLESQSGQRSSRTTQPVGDGSANNPIYTAHSFTVGVDAFDDSTAILLSDGGTYDFGF